MNTIAKVITTISITATLGAGVYSYNTYEQVRTFVNPLIGIHKPEQVDKVHNACFVIIDGSGSGRSTYAVPQVDTIYIKQLIGKIRKAGTGDLWMTFIDASAFNNEVLYLAIPETHMPPKQPKRQGGESLRAFSEQLVQYKKKLAKYESEAPESTKRYEAEEQQFLQQCQSMISKTYAPKAPGTDWSDVTGSLNSALRTLSTIAADAKHYRTILLVSDAKQSLPAGAVITPLAEIPGDIKVVLINAGGSPDHVLAGRAVEVESLARALTKVVYEKPATKLE